MAFVIECCWVGDHTFLHLHYEHRITHNWQFRSHNRIWGFRCAFGNVGVGRVFRKAKFVPFEGTFMVPFILFMVAFIMVPHKVWFMFGLFLYIPPLCLLFLCLWCPIFAAVPHDVVWNYLFMLCTLMQWRDIASVVLGL